MKAAEIVRATRVLPEHLKPGFDKIQMMSREESTRLWHSITCQGIELLRQRAQLIWHFDQEGWDIHALGNGHTEIYLRMAYGQTRLELFNAVADPGLLEKASKLNIPDQLRVVNNERVPVLLNFNDKNQPYFQEMELQKLALKHASNLFHGGKINSEDEQIAYMRSKMKPPTDPKIGILTPDTKRRGALSKIGNVTIFYSLAQLEAAIGAIKAAK